MAKRRKSTEMMVPQAPDYSQLVGEISELLDRARRSAARTVNSILTATYWEIGRRIVEFEQGGGARAEYGEALIKRMARDLQGRHGRGFSRQGLYKMRAFYIGWQIVPTASGQFEARAIFPTPSGISGPSPAAESAPTASNTEGRSSSSFRCEIAHTVSADSGTSWTTDVPLSWSHYVRLMSVQKPQARAFYEAEAIRGGWSVQCSDKHDAVVKYALGGINARVFASKYLTNLPDEETLRREVQTAQRALETRAAGRIEAHEVSR